jgi:hypothetical protein
MDEGFRRRLAETAASPTVCGTLGPEFESFGPFYSATPEHLGRTSAPGSPMPQRDRKRGDS